MKRSWLALSSSLLLADTEAPQPQMENWSKPYASAEFIWWIPRQDGTDFAQSGRALSSSAVPQRAGHTEGIDFDYEPGFKIGAGLTFRYDKWDLFANYTWLGGSQHRGSIHQKTETEGVISEWFILTPSSTVTVDTVTHAHARWKMNFNTLDTRLGRNCRVSKNVAIQPHIGFKAAWIDQDYDVDYALNGSVSPNIVAADLDFDQSFTGFGIRAGMNSAWQCSDHWNVFGNLAFSELWCEFESSRKDHQTPSGGTKFLSFHTKHEFHALRPVVELALGLKYTYVFKNGKRRVDLQGAWEEQVWFNMNQFIGVGETIYGDLTIHGATAKIGYVF